MSGKTRLLSAIGAIGSIICGGLVLSPLVNVVAELFPFLEAMLFRARETESGGIGAVSAGISETVVLGFVALLPAVVINRVLARRARLSGDVRRPLHRIHSILLLLILILIGVPVVLALLLRVSLPVGLLLGVAFATVLTVGVQFLILAAMLTVIARPPRALSR